MSNQTTTILIKRNASNDFDISTCTQPLKRGEPFIDLTTNLLYISDEDGKAIKDLKPLNISGNIIAEHSKVNTAHTFTIDQSIYNDSLFNFTTNFIAQYNVGDTVTLNIGGTTYNATLKLMDGNNPVTGCFKANTVNQLFAAKNNDNTYNLFIQSAVAIWSV